MDNQKSWEHLETRGLRTKRLREQRQMAADNDFGLSNRARTALQTVDSDLFDNDKSRNAIDSGMSHRRSATSLIMTDDLTGSNSDYQPIIDEILNAPERPHSSRLLFSGESPTTNPRHQTDSQFSQDMSENFVVPGMDDSARTDNLPASFKSSTQNIHNNNELEQHRFNYRNNVEQLTVGKEVIVPSKITSNVPNKKDIDVSEIMQNIEKLDNGDPRLAMNFANINSSELPKQKMGSDTKTTPASSLENKAPVDASNKSKKDHSFFSRKMQIILGWTLGVAAWLIVAIPMIIIAIQVLAR